MNVEQVRAKKLYADGKNAEEIAKELSKSKGTIYRWIKENKEEFEKARKLAEINLDDMTDILDEAHKEMILKILEDPETLKDPKIADALIKFVNILEKMSLRSEREKEIKKREEASERGVLIVDDIKESKKKKSE
ncbi:helix-turn-helix domain-containing protein [Fusobacterium necrophorum subsp. funduliforme]|uniref:helix-turn-helix domain-containing protein n=1 Tax=Fusobacterium necrophorum TaxID=859 RepID=UPI00370F6782